MGLWLNCMELRLGHIEIEPETIALSPGVGRTAGGVTTTTFPPLRENPMEGGVRDAQWYSRCTPEIAPTRPD